MLIFGAVFLSIMISRHLHVFCMKINSLDFSIFLLYQVLVVFLSYFVHFSLVYMSSCQCGLCCLAVLSCCSACHAVSGQINDDDDDDDD